jgi:hypothetical protein
LIESLDLRQARVITTVPPYEPISHRVFLFLHSNLDISTLCAVKVKSYSQYRRFVKSVSRLNYLQFSGFNFGRCTAITLTISNDYIGNKKAIRLALNRFEDMLKRKGIFYYVIVKELGDLTYRLHYHAILFNAPKLDMLEVDKVWRIGTDIKFQEVKGVRGGVYYLVSYVKKGLNLQWSRGFFKNGVLSNGVYYLVKYNKATSSVYVDNVFNSPCISKRDYRIFKGRLNKSEMALLIKRNENLNIGGFSISKRL